MAEMRMVFSVVMMISPLNSVHVAA